MTFGINSTGFSQKRLADVLSEATTNLALITDPDSGEALQPDFASTDPAMQIVQVPLEGVSSAWELAAAVYAQFDRNKATGAALHSLVQLNRLDWKKGISSTAPITCTGTPGTIIPLGSQISDSLKSVIWATQASITIGGGGTGTGIAASINVGPYTATAGTLTNILSSVSGWTAVTNSADATAGAFDETDTDLRKRQSNSTMAPSSAPAEAIYSNLLNIPGVAYARVYINNSATVTDSRGIPPKEVAAVVSGGDNTAIAKVLLARTDMSGWFGNTSVTLKDIQGESYLVSFIRPITVPIWIEVDVTAANNFPSDGATQIKNAILAYATGGAAALGITDGFEGGFVPGSTVTVPRLYTPCNFVPGHKITALTIGLSSGALATTDITTLFDHIATFDISRINVVVS